MGKKNTSVMEHAVESKNAIPTRMMLSMRAGEWNLLRLCRLLRHGTIWNLMVDSRGPISLSPLMGGGSWERFPIHHKIDLSANATVHAIIAHNNDLLTLDDDEQIQVDASLREAALVLYLRRIAPAVAYQCSIRNGEIHFVEFRLSYLFNASGSLDLVGQEFERFLSRIPVIPESG